jgi:sterol desaturase/sphingolipid hydroxylase (fatty acid hydroxylase superfamily)
MKPILEGIIAFAVLGGVFRLIERVVPARPPSRLFARRRIVDVLYVFIGGPVGRVIADVLFMIAIVAAIPAIVVMHRGSWHVSDPFGLFARLPFALQVPIALVAVDFFAYFSHRAHHHVTLLWRLHAVHHSSRELDWLAAARNHPIGEATGRILGGLPVVFVGIDPRVLAAVLPIIGLWAIFLHANVRWKFGPLRYVIATPLFHRWHHSRAPEARDKNFAALFPVWDLAFGTFFLPDRQPEDFGVDDHEQVPEGFIGQMLHPFRRSRSHSRSHSHSHSHSQWDSSSTPSQPSAPLPDAPAAIR